VVRRPAGCLGIDPAEPKLGQIEVVDEGVDDANWIVLADPVLRIQETACSAHDPHPQ
jgi:hypothetical protein